MLFAKRSSACAALAALFMFIMTCPAWAGPVCEDLAGTVLREEGLAESFGKPYPQTDLVVTRVFYGPMLHTFSDAFRKTSVIVSEKRKDGSSELYIQSGKDSKVWVEPDGALHSHFWVPDDLVLNLDPDCHIEGIGAAALKGENGAISSDQSIQVDAPTCRGLNAGEPLVKVEKKDAGFFGRPYLHLASDHGSAFLMNFVDLDKADEARALCRKFAAELAPAPAAAAPARVKTPSAGARTVSSLN